MATKTWQINSLERELSSGYVSKAIFRVNGEDGTYKFRATGEVNLEKPSTLIPYADLTETQIIGWVKAKLNDQKDEAGNTIDQVANIEAAVEKGVNEQKTPTTGTGKPW